MFEHYRRSAYDEYRSYGVSGMLKVIAVGASLLIIPALASRQTESSRANSRIDYRRFRLSDQRPVNSPRKRFNVMNGPAPAWELIHLR